ncbi:MAG: hypothetical protein HZA90_01740 [Verrucomicrobia bacterium]|nr:hypothetical protein [Verrucomicrobiota bacterium]
MNSRTSWGAGMGALITSLLAVATGSAVQFQVATDKTAYYPGEVLNVLITATNTAPTEVVLEFSDSSQALYSIDHFYWLPDGAYMMNTSVTIPGYGSYTWSIQHSWGEYRLPPGVHSVTGEVIGYGSAGPVSFTVLDSPVVLGDLLLDFDHIPGTDAPLAHLLAYEECGVEFGMYAGRSAVGLASTSGDHWLDSGVCTYPTGFNLFARLQRPAYGATVKVTAGIGQYISMLAKDSQSNVIASVTSKPTTVPYHFSQSMSLRAAQPIAILEWWPSDPRSLVGIDDLWLEANPAPILAVERCAGGVKVAWPDSMPCLGLEMATNLVTGSWEPVATPPGTNAVILPPVPPGEMRFLRLRVR